MMLLEVVIASAILAAVMALTMGLLMDSTRSVARMSRRGDLENRGRELTSFAKTLLLTGKFYGPGPLLNGISQLGITSSYTEIRFQIPVSRGATDGIVYGFTNKIGLDDPSGAGLTCILRFEADTLLRESAQSPAAVPQPAANWGSSFPSLPTLAEKTLNLDLNGDGDLLDSFLKGKLRRYVVDSSGAMACVETLSDDVILEAAQAGSTTFPYSMEDSATRIREPLLRFVDASLTLVPGSFPGATGRALMLTVWHGSLDENAKEFPLRKSSELLRFRNVQQ
jgi:hypothetical protein